MVHLDEEGEGKHRAVLRNIANLLSDLGPLTRVELVAHGPGVALFLADGPLNEKLQDLIGRGMAAAACGNTLEAMGIGVEPWPTPEPTLT